MNHEEYIRQLPIIIISLYLLACLFALVNSELRSVSTGVDPVPLEELDSAQARTEHSEFYEWIQLTSMHGHRAARNSRLQQARANSMERV